MEWSTVATIAGITSPLISGFILFFVKRKLQYRANLIVFFQHISAHTISLTSNYSVYTYNSDSTLYKTKFDRIAKDKLPLLIKNNNQFWLYGRCSSGTKLTLLKNS